MATCSQCGSELAVDGEACVACAKESEAADRRAKLKVEAYLLDAAPAPDPTPQPGDWGRVEDASPEAQPLAEVRQLRPAAVVSAAPASAPRHRQVDATGQSAEPEQPADVVYLPGAQAEAGQSAAPLQSSQSPKSSKSPSEATPTDGGETPGRAPADGKAAATEAAEMASTAAPEPPPQPAAAQPVVDKPPPQDPDSIPDEATEPVRHRRPVAPPPLLASDALRRELAPAEPHGLLARAVALLSALVGAAASAQLVGTDGVGPAFLGAFFGLALLGVAPMPYGVRATALAVLSGGGLSAALWLRTMRGGDRDEALLAAVVIVCAAALFFRSWHRGSMFARALVAVGIALGMGWLSAHGSLRQMGDDSLIWQSWAPHVLHVLLGILLLLSLLAFMDSRTTGACSVWAVGLLLWYGAHVGVQWLTLLSREGGSAQLASVSPVLSMAYVAAALLAAVLAVSMAQVFAVARAVEPDAH